MLFIFKVVMHYVDQEFETLDDDISFYEEYTTVVLILVDSNTNSQMVSKPDKLLYAAGKVKS